MTLPCPHCKNRFNLDPALLTRGSIKLRCPSCKGLFVVQAPRPRVPAPTGQVPADRPKQGQEPGSPPENDPFSGEHEERSPTQEPLVSSSAENPPESEDAEGHGQGMLPGKYPAPEEPSAPEDPREQAAAQEPAVSGSGKEDPFGDEWELLFKEDSTAPEPPPAPREGERTRTLPGKIPPGFPASRRALFSLLFLLVAGTLLFFGIFRNGDEVVEADATIPGPGRELEQAVSGEDGARKSFNLRMADLKEEGGGAFLRAIRPFSSSDTDATCQALLDLQERVLQSDPPDPCVLYAPWIAYLTMENFPGPTPACKWEVPYRLAIGGIRKGALCARGYAFLAAYYAHKKIPDRALSFLHEAQVLAPLDPWVRIAEVLYQLRVLQDREKAEESLYDIVTVPSVSALSRYLLSCIFISKGEYDKAGEFFEPLVHTYPEQVQFQRIREALSSTREAAYFSPERARGILELGISFAAMRDYVMAEELCREVLQEMPDRLSEEEKKSAYLELGRIHELRGDKMRASVSYRSALRIDPQFFEAKQRIRTLFPNRAEYF